MIKQVIVVRKDLNMRKGKLAAQVAHASLKVLLDESRVDNDTLKLSLDSSLREWINGIFTKVVVSVESEQELLEIYKQACIAGLRTALIIDSGKTEFNGIPTKTCCAIGPDDSDLIDKITRTLKLL